jgi:hypothetical protein
MHWNLILDSGVQDAQAKEKTAAEEKGAGRKDQHRVSRKERGYILEDDGEDETQQDNSSPKDQSHLTEQEKTDRILSLFGSPVSPGKEEIKNDPFDHYENLFPTHQDFQCHGIMKKKASSQGGKDNGH